MAEPRPPLEVLRAYVDDTQVPARVLYAVEHLLAQAREQTVPPTADLDLTRALRRVDELTAIVAERDDQLAEAARRRADVLLMLAELPAGDGRVYARARELYGLPTGPRGER